MFKNTKKEDLYKKGLEYLNKYVEDKTVDVYYNNIPTYYGVYHNTNNPPPVVESYGKVYKQTRKMKVSDLLNPISEEQENLKYLFELEKEVAELRKLKNSIDELKKFVKE